MDPQGREGLFERTFPGKLDLLAEMSDYVMQAARQLGMDDRDLFAIQMAVDEAATNIIVHGYEERNLEGPVRILCWNQGSDFVVQLRDLSPPFDPGEVPEPDLHASLENRKEGGLGIYLMRKLMKQVTFTREGDENVLTMVRQGPLSVPLAPRAAVVSPEGRFDATRAASLERLLREPIEEGKNAVVVDLSQVAYLSSGGLRALLIIAKELRERDGCLLLCCARPGVAQVLQITGFTDIIPLHTSQDAALRALESSCESEV
jgi:anti-anti-sigma factor